MRILPSEPPAGVPLVALLLASACGGGGAQAEGRLALSGRVPEPDRVVRRIEVPADPSAWSVDAESATVIELDGSRALRIVGDEDTGVTVPGRFDPADFDVVLVEVAAGEDFTLRVGVARGGPDGEPVRTGSLDTGWTLAGDRRTHTFDLRRIGEHAVPGETFDELLLLANGKELDWTLLDVALVRRDPARWLPAVDGPPGLVDLGGEARMAWGLVGGSPLSARVRVPAAAVLDVSFAPAPGTSAPAGLALVVHAGEEGSSVALARVAAAEDGGWRHARVDLGPLAGRTTLLSFELESPTESHGESQGGPALAAITPPVVSRPDASARTVLLVTSDTHRADHVGAAGAGVGAGVLTPALDELALRGVLFEDCFASSNITLASHAALMTGTTPRDTGVTNNRTRLAERATTLAELFREAGYATYAVVSAKHMNPSWSGLGQGFDRVSWPARERERSAGESVERLERWLADAAGRPLFVWLHLYDAHRPYAPPEELARAYYGDDRDPFDRRLPAPEVPVPPHLRNLRDLEYVNALYKGEVSYLDRELTRVLGHPRFGDAVIAVTADHGESFGEQGLWWDHVGVYPSVLHVPLILAWPGGPRNRRVSHPVRQIDVAHTLLALARIDRRGFPGRDLGELVHRRPDGDEPRFALGSDGHALAMTHGPWHLVVNLHDREAKPHLTTRDLPRDHPVELFDLSVDPRCEHDLSRTAPERVRRMAGALLRWIESPEGSLADRNVVDEDAAATLGELGYAAGGDGDGSELVDLELLRAKLAEYLAE